MEALPNPPRRRKRYERARQSAAVTITPIKRRLLRWLLELHFASLPQLARLADISPKSARRHLRELFDGGFVQVIACSPAALAQAEDPNDARLLFGSAPNIYSLERAGEQALRQSGVSVPPARRVSFGPQNSYFLAHELSIRDVRGWLEGVARSLPSATVERWHHGEDAAISLSTGASAQVVRPDAWFSLKLGGPVLVGLAEVDMATEGALKWRKKLQDYQTLFTSGRLPEVTGYENARLLIVTSTARRRDSLTSFIEKEADEGLARHCWLAVRPDLANADLASLVWRVPGRTGLLPLIPAAVLARDSAAPV